MRFLAILSFLLVMMPLAGSINGMTCASSTTRASQLENRNEEFAMVLYMAQDRMGLSRNGQQSELFGFLVGVTNRRAHMTTIMDQLTWSLKPLEEIVKERKGFPSDRVDVVVTIDVGYFLPDFAIVAGGPGRMPRPATLPSGGYQHIPGFIRCPPKEGKVVFRGYLFQGDKVVATSNVWTVDVAPP